MKKHQPTPDSDITQEPYKGPSYTTTMAGEAGIAHFFTLVGGLLLGGAGGFIFHKRVGGVIKSSREWLGGLKESPRILSKVFGSIADEIMGAGEKFVELCKGSEKVSKWLEKRDAKAVAAAIDGAILTGGAGFIGGIFLGAGTGAATARRGREQFERAKEAVRDERAINEELREKYAAAQAELETLKSEPKKKLHVAQDDPPPLTEPEPTPTVTPAKTEHRAHAPSHAAEHAHAHASHAEKIAAEKAQHTEAALG